MIILGVDGGGTKTHALAMDESGHLIGSGVGGCSNYHQVGLQAALECVQDAAQQALQGKRPEMAVYCLAACDTSLDETRLKGGLSATDISAQFLVLNDAFAALRAGTTRPYGVSVICGTGFNACGIGLDGNRAILHSLGPLTGDWGGGYSLGEAAFGAVFRADEGRGEPTSLKEMLLNALGMPDLEAVAQAIINEAISQAQVGALAHWVFEAARMGDPAAMAIVHRQAEEIAIAALTMLRRLGMTALPVDIVLSGGVIRGGGALLLTPVQERIYGGCPQAEIKSLSMPAVVGAALLAFDRLGLPAPTPESLAKAVEVFG